ncbi:MAG: CotY/CotZ family spore coat protein [Bacilli bacterium]|nr:CotY/CotZ family spore coat protein [Bacilli bacterium]MDD4607937.1 CotY/CotZ family spore coat protein [Bacilli bacterium]
MCNKDQKDCNCIAEILKVILILQQNACQDDTCLETCDRGFLGCNVASIKCNTRPVMLFTACGNGDPWTMPLNKADDSCQGQCQKSCVFRIEKLDGCCATFRVLAPNPDTCEAATRPYVATNSFFTINLECVCCIRCLPDTFVDCV